MGKRGRQQKKTKAKSADNLHLQNSVSSPQHATEKITRYFEASPQPVQQRSATPEAHEAKSQDKCSASKGAPCEDLLSNILTPESTPTKPPHVPLQDEEPSPNRTLPYPLEGELAVAGQAPLHREGAGEGEVNRPISAEAAKGGEKMKGQSEAEMKGASARHSMTLSGQSHHAPRTPTHSPRVSRSLQDQLTVEESPKRSKRGRGKKSGGKATGESTSLHNKGTKTSSKSRSKDELTMQTMKDFFPVRRSDRRCKSVMDAERKLELEEAILSNSEFGLEVKEIIGKGRGVISTKPFRRGDFVVEYYGDLIDLVQAKQRELKYKNDSSIGCYMYYFEYKSKSYCVDATRESGRLGRLLNHSRHGNCCTKLVEIAGRPHLILVARRDIGVGEELLYDYGDRSKETLESHPWLAL